MNITYLPSLWPPLVIPIVLTTKPILVSIYWSQKPILSWQVSFVEYKSCHVALKYNCLVKKSDHVTPTYLRGTTYYIKRIPTLYTFKYTLENGNYHIRTYFLFIKHQILGIVCNILLFLLHSTLEFSCHKLV